MNDVREWTALNSIDIWTEPENRKAWIKCVSCCPQRTEQSMGIWI